MPQQVRDYTNLRETEYVYYAVNKNSTHFKDYSMEHLCQTRWRGSNDMVRRRIVDIVIDSAAYGVVSVELAQAINDFVDEADENDWLPRKCIQVPGVTHIFEIDTRDVNWECLRDHVARFRVGDKEIIVDLEELMKATRYA